MKKRSPVIFTLVYGALLTGLTAYVLLDSFVIPHRYASASAAYAESVDRVDPEDGEGAQSAGNRMAGEDIQTVEKPTAEEGTQSDKAPSNAPGSGHKHRPDGGPKGWGKTKPSGGKSRTDSTDQRTGEAADADTTADTAAGAGATEDTAAGTDKEDVRTYHDNGVDITLKEYRVNGTNVYVADVKLASADHLKTALAENTYGRNITEEPSVMAENNNAVLAINGDYYGSRQTGYVIREGVLYRDKKKSGSEDLVVLKNGEFLIINEDDVEAQELLDMGAWQVFSFGPALVTDGEIAVEADEEVGKAMQSNPRTAIGIIDDLHYVFVVADGRTSDNAGLTLRDLANLIKDLGVKTAYNLDGGGSSAMIFEGELINNPTTGGRKIGERSVSDIVYIG